MGNGETFALEGETFDPKDVEIDRARGPAFAALPTERELDSLKCEEERLGSAVEADQQRGIQVIRLIGATDGRGLVDAGDPLDVCDFRNENERLLQRRESVAQIRPQTDDDPNQGVVPWSMRGLLKVPL